MNENQTTRYGHVGDGARRVARRLRDRNRKLRADNAALRDMLGESLEGRDYCWMCDKYTDDHLSDCRLAALLED